MQPVLSILVPNYNNGRDSSPSGRNYLDSLFRSLAETLEHDPTPLEIIVADDGSTDDSLDTCRRWAARSWRGGEPFCRLLELPHTGIISTVANRLARAARGDLCCRLDGDIVVLTKAWASALRQTFEAGPPRMGIVGAKQLAPDGRIHSAGDWVLHPRGYHHIGQGASSDSVSRAREVDHVMGCFYGHRRSIWEELGGYDQTLLRGQTVDFGLRARLAGWSTIATPAIEFIHYHSERAPRATAADSEGGLADSLARFRDKWGFDRLAPDLDDVADRYAGTPLLWNTRVFGPHAPWPAPATRPIAIGESDWARFTADESYRRAVLWRVAVAVEVSRRLGTQERVCHLYSREGMLCHFLAQRGASCVGVDSDPHFVELARTICGAESYPAERPRFHVQTELRRLPLADGEVDTLLLFDVIEHHPNPVGLYREAQRVLRPGGVLVIVTAMRSGPLESDSETSHFYRPHELLVQLGATRCFELVPMQLDGAGTGMLITVAKKAGREESKVGIATIRDSRSAVGRATGRYH